MHADRDEELKHLQYIVMRTAAKVLVDVKRGIEWSEKPDRSLVTQLDKQLQHELLVELDRDWPGCPALAEESSVETQRELINQTERTIWIIDPLDGTTNLVKGIPCFAVSVAQVSAGYVERAVVFDPVHAECFTARRHGGAWLNDERLAVVTRPSALRDAVALIDYKRLPAKLARQVAVSPPFRSQRNFGVAALEWCWIACGRGDVYLHGGQQIWDYAAGQLVLREAGGQAVNLNGELIQPRSLKPSGVVAASHAALFEQWRDWLNL